MSLKVKLKVAVVLFFCITANYVYGQNISTVPDTTDGPAYIAASDGEVNVTIMCTVFIGPTQQVQTPWFLQREQTDSSLRQVFFLSSGVPNDPSEFADNLFATGELVEGTSDTFLTIFKFLTFTAEFDTTRVECGASNERRAFIVGFPGTLIIIIS